MRPGQAHQLQEGDIVGMRYNGAPRFARVRFTTSLRVYLETETLPRHLRPLNLEWVRPTVLTAIILKGTGAQRAV